MSVMIGSARHDENGKYSGGKKGDQLNSNSSSLDTTGEVSMQKFYVHSKGWVVLRCTDESKRAKIAEGMMVACNNKNIGYSQSDREGITKNGVWSTVPCNADCSTTVRACLKYAGIDVPNFTTANEKTIITNTKMFLPFNYVSATITPLMKGDILVTKSKGHTAIVVSA